MADRRAVRYGVVPSYWDRFRNADTGNVAIRINIPVIWRSFLSVPPLTSAVSCLISQKLNRLLPLLFCARIEPGVYGRFVERSPRLLAWYFMIKITSPIVAGSFSTPGLELFPEENPSNSRNTARILISLLRGLIGPGETSFWSICSSEQQQKDHPRFLSAIKNFLN